MSEIRVDTISEKTSANGVAIDSVTLKDGGATLTDNITFSASGKGVHLGVTTATASNLLDDYEEGSWTPTTNTGQGLTVNGAKYTKIGQFVFLNFYVALTTISSTSSDRLEIGGLPFTSNNQSVYGMGVISYMGGVNFNDQTGPLVAPNSTDMYFHQNDGTTATISINEMNSRSSGGVPLLGGVVYQVPE